MGADAARQISTAPSTRASLRNAVQRILTCDGEASERAGLVEAMAALRVILVKSAVTARSAGFCNLRAGTKQQQVIHMLRRPKRVIIAQIAEANWLAPRSEASSPA